MKYLLVPWLLFALPAEAIPTGRTDELTPLQICEAVENEVTVAVQLGLMDEATGWSIITRCFRNYG